MLCRYTWKLTYNFVSRILVETAWGRFESVERALNVRFRLALSSRKNLYAAIFIIIWYYVGSGCISKASQTFLSCCANISQFIERETINFQRLKNNNLKSI